MYNPLLAKRLSQTWQKFRLFGSVGQNHCTCCIKLNGFREPVMNSQHISFQPLTNNHIDQTQVMSFSNTLTLYKNCDICLDDIVLPLATSNLKINVDQESSTTPASTLDNVKKQCDELKVIAGTQIDDENIGTIGAKIAMVVWLSNIYKTTSILSREDLEILIQYVMTELPDSTVFLHQSGIELLNFLAEKTSIKLNSSPVKRTSVFHLPLRESCTVLSGLLGECAGNLAIANIALCTEVARINFSFLDSPLLSLNSTVTGVALGIKWLLDESKLQHLCATQGSDIDIMTRSCFSVATLIDAAVLAAGYSRTDLKTIIKNSAAQHSVPITFDVLKGPRTSLLIACESVILDSSTRLRTIMLPTLRKRLEINETRIVQPWPLNAPAPDCLCPPAPGVNDASFQYFQNAVEALTTQLTKFQQEQSTNDSQLENLTQLLTSMLAIEFSIGVLIIEDEKIDVYNGAVTKVLKKKKNTSGKFHMGQPLASFLDIIMKETSVVSNDSLGHDATVSSALKIPLLLSGLKLLKYDQNIKQALTIRNQVSRRPKIPKGAMDHNPRYMAIKDTVFDIIRSVFIRYGAVSIDTPIFELKEILTGKYGEDQKLIFDLKDQGGEQLSLRYDLTVPFARVIATHNLDKIKRFHIGKVYRRDEPQMARGRFREFFQCDFDVAGEYGLMIPDAEIISALVDILRLLEGSIGKFLVKLNHRCLLDAIMELCGVPSTSFRAICSAIDKLDKLSWDDVKTEMCVVKGLDPDVADKIHSFLEMKGQPLELLDQLESMNDLMGLPSAKETLIQLRLLFGFLEVYKTNSEVVLDLSLARGLDYYTGVIFEAVLPEQPWLGSVGAGGRYDQLVKMFSGKQIPSVGVSIGVERLFRIIESNLGITDINLASNEVKTGSTNASKKLVTPQPPAGFSSSLWTSQIDVLVCSACDDHSLTHRMRICKMLRDANIIADFLYTERGKLGKQMQHASELVFGGVGHSVFTLGARLAVIFGPDELATGTVKIRPFEYEQDAAKHTHDNITHEKITPPVLEIQVDVKNVVAEVKNMLGKVKSAFDRTRLTILNSASYIQK